MLTLEYFENNPNGNYYLKGSSPVAGILLSFLGIEDGLVVLSYFYKGKKQEVKAIPEQLYRKRLARIEGVKCFDEDCRIEIINEDLMEGDLIFIQDSGHFKVRSINLEGSCMAKYWQIHLEELEKTANAQFKPFCLETVGDLKIFKQKRRINLFAVLKNKIYECFCYEMPRVGSCVLIGNTLFTIIKIESNFRGNKLTLKRSIVNSRGIKINALEMKKTETDL